MIFHGSLFKTLTFSTFLWRVSCRRGPLEVLWCRGWRGFWSNKQQTMQQHCNDMMPLSSKTGLHNAITTQSTTITTLHNWPCWIWLNICLIFQCKTLTHIQSNDSAGQLRVHHLTNDSLRQLRIHHLTNDSLRQLRVHHLTKSNDSLRQLRADYLTWLRNP